MTKKKQENEIDNLRRRMNFMERQVKSMRARILALEQKLRRIIDSPVFTMKEKINKEK